MEDIFHEERVQRAARYQSVAKLSINGFEGQALIRNISTTGFCLASKTYAELEVGRQYDMRIYPETDSNVPEFDLKVEVRWLRCSKTVFAAGLKILHVSNPAALKQYVDFLRR